MQSLGNIEELRIAAVYFSIRSSVRKTSFVPLLIAAILGVSSMSVDAWKSYLITAAAAMVLYAIWVIVTANPIALIINGLILTIGGFGLSAGVVWTLIHGSNSARGIFIGIAGGVWGLSCLRKYRGFKLSISAMNEPARVRVQELVQSLKRAKLADDFEFIELYQDRYKIKVRFMNDGVLLTQGSDIAIMNKIEFAMTRKALPRTDGKPEKWVKVNLLLRGNSVVASIKPECIQRYESWKGTSVAVAASAP